MWGQEGVVGVDVAAAMSLEPSTYFSGVYKGLHLALRTLNTLERGAGTLHNNIASGRDKGLATRAVNTSQ